MIRFIYKYIELYHEIVISSTIDQFAGNSDIDWLMGTKSGFAQLCETMSYVEWLEVLRGVLS